MPSRPLTRAQLIDQCESILQDSSNATFSAAELGLLLDDAITEVSEAVPYVMRDVYQLETRTGTATSTSANNLVDVTEVQFAPTDVNKVVYNVDDNTWAVITSYSSTSQVGLSQDIFTSGEQYEIYNEGCWASNQININNSNDFLWIVKVCYPVDRADNGRETPRNFTLLRKNDFNNVLEIDAAYLDDTKDTDADKDVYVYFAKQHKLNPMTDLVGELTAAPVVGATTIAVDGLQNSGTVYKDTLFYFTQIKGVTANSRLIYRVTADASTSGAGAATLYFYPGLESALNDNDDMTFIGSTLTPELERILTQIVAGEALMSKSIKNINNIVTGEAVSAKQFATGERIAEKARIRLHRKVDVNLRADVVYSRS